MKDIKFGFYIYEGKNCNEIYAMPCTYDLRPETEKQAWLKAFEILEKQLS